MTAEEAGWVLPYVKELIACAPHPRNHVLQEFLRHARSQPEVFALAERTLSSLPMKRPHRFSIRSVFTYARQTAQRVKGALGKQFTLPHPIAPLYDRAAIRRHPQLNGWTLFKEDSKGTLRRGQANALLGCTLAPKRINGEPYRRLVWTEVGQ